MDERERRIAEEVLLAFFIENVESDEDRAGWERARRDGRASQGESVSELLPALQARLDAIMAKRPAHICAAHWLQQVEGAARVEVLSCTCQPAPVEHHRGQNWHPAPVQVPIPRLDDGRAAVILKSRVTSGPEPKRTAAEQSLLDDLERLKRRPLSHEEKWLALEQARMMGHLE